MWHIAVKDVFINPMPLVLDLLSKAVINISKPGKIVDENGEIIGSINIGDRIIRKESIDFLVGKEVWKIEHFYKGNIAEMRKQLESLSTYEKAFLFSIAMYVGYEDCCIKYDNGRCLGFDDLIKISKFSREKAWNTINSLIKMDIIYKGKNSMGLQYFVNPWLFCKGTRIDKVLKTMFKNYRVKVMNGTKWGDLHEFKI